MKNSMELKNICQLAWQFIKKNGMSKSEAFRKAWANFKLKVAMKHRIVKFRFEKVDGSIRLAYGCLIEKMMAPIKGTERKENPTTQTYWDCEKNEYRCFRKANLLSIG